MIFFTVSYQDKEGNFAFSTEFQNNQQYWSLKNDNLSIVKVCQKDDIPAKMIKINKYSFVCFIAKDFKGTLMQIWKAPHMFVFI